MKTEKERLEEAIFNFEYAYDVEMTKQEVEKRLESALKQLEGRKLAVQ